MTTTLNLSTILTEEEIQDLFDGAISTERYQFDLVRAVSVAAPGESVWIGKGDRWFSEQSVMTNSELIEHVEAVISGDEEDLEESIEDCKAACKEVDEAIVARIRKSNP